MNVQTEINHNNLAALSPDEIARIEQILGGPRDATVRGAFDPATGALAGEPPLVPVDAQRIASVTSIRTHGGFEALNPEELQRIEKILGNPTNGDVRGAFDPATGALAGEAPLVPVDARQIASVTSIKTHGA
jgi:hypothetical protein